jgi:hypothetical protein
MVNDKLFAADALEWLQRPCFGAVTNLGVGGLQGVFDEDYFICLCA